MDKYGMNEVSLEGFQLVRAQMFGRASEPSMTIWPTSVAFNMACYSALNDCACIQIMVNTNDRKIAVIPCPAKDADAISWLKGKENKKYKKLDCSKFGRQLFETWGLNKEYHYRAMGRLVAVGQKVLLMFDYSSPEAWRGLKMVNDNAL